MIMVNMVVEIVWNNINFKMWWLKYGKKRIFEENYILCQRIKLH